MQFSPITLEHFEVWKSYWTRAKFRTADTTFVNLFGWALAYGLECSESHNLFWIRKTKGATPTLWMPIGNTENVNWDEALSQFEPGTQFERIPLPLAQSIKESSTRVKDFTPTRDQDEYLYEREALAKFEGRKLHKKRSHLNAYERLYGVDYRNLTKEDAPIILDLSATWLKDSPEDASLELEHSAIERMLGLWALDDSIRAGGLFVDGKLVAYDFGSAIDAENFVVHIEKGLPEYRGVYPTIVKNFAEFGIPESFRFINREQDLGDEGLRYSKMTYQPSGFIEKAAFVLS